MTPKIDEPQLEVMAPTALESITRGEIDLQIATAHRFPRSMASFKKRALDMALIDEETAESCIYCRPVGMKDGKQQYAEGMSIRMAEIVGASYGNIRVGSMIIEQTERMVRCRGMAHDLESNFASTSECIESTVTRNGQPFSEGMRAVVAKACLAKAWRDALFKVVPKALCKPIETETRKLAAGDSKSLEARRATVMQWVSKLGIDVTRVFSALGIKGEEDIGSDHLLLLTGLKNALKDGDTTIEEAFPPIGANPDGAPKFVPKPKPEPATETPAEPKSEQQSTTTVQDSAPAPATKPRRTPAKPKEQSESTDRSVQAPASDPAPAASTPATPKASEAPQPPAQAHGWRDFVIESKAANFNGRKLGDLNKHEMQAMHDYAEKIDMSRATIYQKKLVAALALSKADLPGAHVPEHTATLRANIDRSKIREADFLAECHKAGWVDESHTSLAAITEDEAKPLLADWASVELQFDNVPA